MLLPFKVDPVCPQTVSWFLQVWFFHSKVWFVIVIMWPDATVSQFISEGTRTHGLAVVPAAANAKEKCEITGVSQWCFLPAAPLWLRTDADGRLGRRHQPLRWALPLTPLLESSASGFSVTRKRVWGIGLNFVCKPWSAGSSLGVADWRLRPWCCRDQDFIKTEECRDWDQARPKHLEVKIESRPRLYTAKKQKSETEIHYKYLYFILFFINYLF